MFRLVPFVLLLSLSAAHETLFEEFEAEFNKVYETVAERAKRMAIFMENLVEIERNRLTDPEAHFSHLTPFADWTQHEFLARNKLSMERAAGEWPVAPTLPTDDLPDSFDWRDMGAVNEVKNQAQCGSCWAFATVANIEGVNFVKTGKLLSLSEQELVDCDKGTGDMGCNGGLPPNAYEDMINNKFGLVLESDYPYAGVEGKCQATHGEERVFINSWAQISTDETQIAAALIKYGPLAIGVNAGPMQFYKGGVAHPWRCSPRGIDHAVTLVGFGTDGGRDYWVIRNSWGPDWGEQGHWRIVRGKGACGLNQLVTTAIMGDSFLQQNSSAPIVV